MDRMENLQDLVADQEFAVVRAVINPDLIENVLKIINLDLHERGISRREIDWWESASCWFPHLRTSNEVLAIRDSLPEFLREGVECEPQILAAFPEEQRYPLFAHTDEEPAWAAGRKYRTIIGVPLTPFTEKNGGVVLYTKQGEVIPQLNVGDVLVIHPNLPHSRGINVSGYIRYALYFRYLNNK